MAARREDLPELRGFAHLGANNEYGSELFDVKFYPYTQPRTDPVFAATGSSEVYICRPVCKDKKVIDVLRVYRDTEIKEGCVFNSIAWTKLEDFDHTEESAEQAAAQSKATDYAEGQPQTAPPVDESQKQETKPKKPRVVPLLCVAGQLPKIKVLNILTGEIERTLIGHGRAINDIAISPINHNLLASCSGDSTIRLWNLQKEFKSNPCVGLLAGNHHEKDILSIDFHSSGRYMIAGGMDLKVTLWILPELPDKPQGPEDTAYVMHPHFASRDVHVDMVDCVKFHGNNIISRSAKSCQIQIWRIVGFDEYVDAYDTHEHSCGGQHFSSSFSDNSPTTSSSQSEKYCSVCDSCPLCNLPASPRLNTEISTSSAFNLSSGKRSKGSTVGLQGETGIQILLTLELPHSNLFYMRFGLYEPIVEHVQGRRARHRELAQKEVVSSSAPRRTKKGQRKGKSTPVINETEKGSLWHPSPGTPGLAGPLGVNSGLGFPSPFPDYDHTILCAGNERSRFYFWDLDALETGKLPSRAGSSAASGGSRGKSKGGRNSPAVLGTPGTSNPMVASSLGLGVNGGGPRSLRAARQKAGYPVGESSMNGSVVSDVDMTGSIVSGVGAAAGVGAVGLGIETPTVVATGVTATATPTVVAMGATGTATPTLSVSESAHSALMPGLVGGSGAVLPAGANNANNSLQLSQQHLQQLHLQTDQESFQPSVLADSGVPVPPHRTATVSKINFTIRQIGWSVGGEWAVGCGDSGMLAVFGRA